MIKSDAITLHAKAENWPKFPVFVWDENGEMVTEVDGKVFRAQTCFGPLQHSFKGRDDLLIRFRLRRMYEGNRHQVRFRSSSSRTRIIA